MYMSKFLYDACMQASLHCTIVYVCTTVYVRDMCIVYVRMCIYKRH